MWDVLKGEDLSRISAFPDINAKSTENSVLSQHLTIILQLDSLMSSVVGCCVAVGETERAIGRTSA